MDDFHEYQRRKMRGEDVSNYKFKGEVKEMPKCFDEWVDKNRERAKGWSTMPYFVRDNPQFVKNFRVDIYSADEKKFTRAYHTKPAMQKSLETYLQKKYPHIPNTEKAAIYDYCRGDVSDFRHLNKELRENKLSEFNVAFSNLLSKALSKLPKEEAVVYRTIRLNKTKLNQWIAKAKNKEAITFEGLTSTSKSIDTVHTFIQKKASNKKNNETDIILIIDGKNGHPIKDFSEFKEQEELLFDKGSKFKFDDYFVEGNQYSFILREQTS